MDIIEFPYLDSPVAIKTYFILQGSNVPSRTGTIVPLRQLNINKALMCLPGQAKKARTGTIEPLRQLNINILLYLWLGNKQLRGGNLFL